MKNTYDKIFQLINTPDAIRQYSNHEWNELVSQARFHDLLPFVFQFIETQGYLDTVPDPVLKLLTGYRVRLEFKHQLFRWESGKIENLITELDYPVVLLKGMAYLQDCVSTYASRDFTDLDLLVAKDHFAEFEQILLSNGWMYRDLDSYDEHYYREWSHASPPMVNRESGLELDLHHHISSPIAKNRIDTKLLLPGLKSIENSDFYRLSDIDVILHCANHFIYLDNILGRVKDLLFIYFLIPQQAPEKFWRDLIGRSKLLGLETTLFYLLRLLEHYFQIKPDDDLVKSLEIKDCLSKKIVFNSLKTCLCPVKPEGFRKRLAEKILIIRFQWTRYPLTILAYHIAKKHIFMKLKSKLTRAS